MMIHIKKLTILLLLFGCTGKKSDFVLEPKRGGLAVTGQVPAAPAELRLASSYMQSNDPPETVPEAPANLQAVFSDGVSVISWDDPGDPNITGYEYRARLDGETAWRPDWRLIEDSTALTTGGVCRNIAPGLLIFFEIRAVNSLGVSAGSSAEAVEITLSYTPSAPANLQATSTDGVITLTWDDPEDRSIMRYQYRARVSGESDWSPDWTPIKDSSPSTTTAECGNVNSGTTMIFEIRADNAKGYGTPSRVEITL